MGRRGRSFIGCSGWSYDHWRGIVYPADLPTDRWFEHYTTLFDTVELNSTFYRLPSEQTAKSWGKAAPPGFVYALKLGSYGSHRRKLRGASTWIPNHVARAELLGDALGPTLVQLPPRWHRDTERLDEFLDAAPTELRWAVEFRDPSWLHDDVFDVLRRHRAALCVHDLLAEHPFVLTTTWTYLRFHGPGALEHAYEGAYGGHRLAPRAKRIRSLLDDGNDVYCYFNNDSNGHAVADATYLRDAVSRDS
jgi:uncharacterized protein YecE (DUF72 family)